MKEVKDVKVSAARLTRASRGWRLVGEGRGMWGGEVLRERGGREREREGEAIPLLGR